MAKYRHFLIEKSPQISEYKYPQKARGPKFHVPTRNNRREHAEKLNLELNQAKEQAASADREGITLEFRGEPGFDLKFENLDPVASQGIELMNVRHEENIVAATAYIPPGKLDYFFKLFDRCSKETSIAIGKKQNSPRNQSLFDSISTIRLAAVKAFWTDNLAFPTDTQKPHWWEVWIRAGKTKAQHDEAFTRFSESIISTNLSPGTGFLAFPERLAFLIRGTIDDWSNNPTALNLIAELRLAKEVPTHLITLNSSDQREWVNDAAARISPAATTAPAICILDTGVWRDHPLLEKSLATDDCHTIEPRWGKSDRDPHGTEMAGIALFGPDLQDIINHNKNHTLATRLESVKILPPNGSNNPEHYGYLTQEGVARSEQNQPHRPRTICMAISSDDRDQGYPSLWSSAIDNHSSGAEDDQQRLYVLSTGNYRELTNSSYQYPKTNYDEAGIEDPGQSWNALTVGACANRVFIQSSEEFSGWKPVAPDGGLLPTSRTSMMWTEKTWPIKPEVVMGGGNWAWDSSSTISPCTDLELLTTTANQSGRLLDTMRDTSSATAQVSRMAATIQSHYPKLWPETIRALIVHSARWSPQMLSDFPGHQQISLQKRLRCYGYGIPDLNRALWSVKNQVCMILEGELQPFQNTGSSTNKIIKSNEMHFHTLPWPIEALQQIPEKNATIRITLSYFVEPSPARRGWTNKFRYQSHGLRFKLRGPLEDSSNFRKRLSKAFWEDKNTQNVELKEPQNWALGSGSHDLTTKGSIHSNWWTASATEIANCGELAVFPVTGWWKERKHLDKHESRTRYALVITIETSETNVDLYNPISNQLSIQPQIVI